MMFAVVPASAQAGFKPSVPQFTVKLIDDSYDVPPVTTTVMDPYTGKETITTTPGYRVEQKAIEVTIKNQPFTPYTIESSDIWKYGQNGQQFNLYYEVQFKGHFSEDWQNFVNPYDIYFLAVIVQSDSEYTVVSQVANYEAGSQLDFRVKAIIGYTYNAAHNNAAIIPPQWSIQKTDDQSDWSGIQVFTVPDNPSASASPSQTATLPTSSIASDGNDQPQYPNQIQPPNSTFDNSRFMLAAGVLFVSVVIAVVIIVLRRHFKNSTIGEGLYA
jgi:hypothetical protein